MKEYIERETTIEALQKCEEIADIYGVKPTLNDFKNAIYNLTPAADIESIKHGKWEKTYSEYFFKCSVCETTANANYKYCPNCGAKMDGGNK